MLLVSVLIEYTVSKLNRPFSYAYLKDDNLIKGIRVIVPFNNKLVMGYVIDVNRVDETIEEYSKRTKLNLKEIISVVDKEPLLNEELLSLANKVANYYFAPLVSVFQTMLPPSLKPRLTALKKPKISYEVYVSAITSDDSDLTPRQTEIFQLIKNNGPILKSELKTTLLPILEEKKKITYILKEKHRLVQEEVSKSEKKVLNDEQEKALNSILNDDYSVYLLEGVTGSGKTEVYLQAAEKIIESGKSVLMLVPEISLTVQMVRRFKARFNDIAILHSDLTPGEKYDEYRRIRNNEVKIVVGARSAIFAPLENIGLIIIDEEHAETYKQEVVPFYDARKVALFRQEAMPGLKIIFGSATPSFETKIRALRGVYHQLYLTKRFNDMPLPETKIIDLLDYNNIDEKSVIFSKTLRDAIQDRLNKKEQTLLLINRRGYAPFVSCRKCGRTLKCPTCDLPLTFHTSDNLLKCHHCGYVTRMVASCPSCGSTSFSKVGFGTEKVESELKKLFKDIRTLRLDSDVAKVRSLTKKVISSFEKEEADVLIGTQMIAKGHDFKNVTLVGIVLADLGLNVPSYRAGERTYSLLSQAIGRAGRGDKKGEAIIQTYLPKNYVITDACLQDYNRFFNEEMVLRKENQYPPYVYLAILTFASTNDNDVENVALYYKNYLEARFANKKVDVIGPSEPFLVKLNNKFRRKIILKFKSYEDVRDVLLELNDNINKNSRIELSVNIDPCEDY